MSTAIDYSPPAIQVTRDDVCYITPGNTDIKHGFLIVTYMGDEKLSSVLEAIDGATVAEYTLTPCPIVIQNQLNDKKVVVLRNKNDQSVVYGVQVLNENGGVNTQYFNIDGTPYTGAVTDLELANDVLNYSSPVVFCHNGTSTVTRTDVWDESRNLVAVIWQDVRGVIIAEPAGNLNPGSCNMPLDTEVIRQVDNRLNTNNKVTGEYAYFYRVNVHDNLGTVIHSLNKLSNGQTYVPVGKVSTEPIIPEVYGKVKRITGGQEWQSSSITRSVAFAVEYANSQNTVQLTSPGDDTPIVLQRIRYKGEWSVDDGSEAYLATAKIKANGSSSVLVTYTERPQMIEVNPLTGFDPLDTVVPVPEELEDQV